MKWIPCWCQLNAKKSNVSSFSITRFPQCTFVMTAVRTIIVLKSSLSVLFTSNLNNAQQYYHSHLHNCKQEPRWVFDDYLFVWYELRHFFLLTKQKWKLISWEWKIHECELNFACNDKCWKGFQVIFSYYLLLHSMSNIDVAQKSSIK